MIGGLLAAEPGGAQPPVTALPLTPASVLPTPYIDPARSARVLTDRVEAEPSNVELRLALARELTALGVLTRSDEEAAAAFERAAASALAAVELAPDEAEPHYWAAAARGLHADREGGRSKISLASEAHEHTLQALEIAPLHGGANHVLGRLHAGAKRLGFASRMIAGLLGLGDILDEASWESAERRMRLAVERDPSLLVHHVELGKLLLHLDQVEEGTAILNDVVARTPRHETDAFYMAKAADALAESTDAR